MDQEVAALWAAGIGVAGAVVSAVVAIYAVRKSAAAQVESAAASGHAQVQAALAGARMQLAGQRDDALWQARKSAYASFLGAVEHVRMCVVHMCEVAGAYEEGRGASGDDLTEAKKNLDESFKALWFRESLLRLSVEEEEARSAEEIMLLARRVVEDVDDYGWASWSHQRDSEPAWLRLKASKGEFEGRVTAWAEAARRTLARDESASS
ncbi:hypothetical protein ACIGD1_24585 [Streptomyces sp. NPDC085612]|uniref:hypothetical protein n=1 Tax=Streptomyces sp. NPDC085612 TaxID=3365732 RepID=UPI0037D5AF16